MKKNIRFKLILFINIFFLSTLSYAQTPSNDKDNYQGDKISFPHNVTGAITGTAETICIPAKIPMLGLGEKTDNDGLNVVVLTDFFGKTNSCDSPVKEIKDGVLMNISSEQFKSGGEPNRYGFTYGALVVPYKYHSSGSKNFNGNTSIGPYLGYRFDQNDIGLGIKVIGFAGSTNIEVNRVVNGEDTSESLSGFSYGLGMLGQVKNEFQFGIIFGKDRVSKSSGYENNGKTWVALALGFSFSN